MEYRFNSVVMTRGSGVYSLAHIQPVDQARDSILLRSWQVGAHPLKSILQTGYNPERKNELMGQMVGLQMKQENAGYTVVAEIKGLYQLSQALAPKLATVWTRWFELESREQLTKFTRYLRQQEMVDPDPSGSNAMFEFLNAVEEGGLAGLSQGKPTPISGKPAPAPAPVVETMASMPGYGAWA